MTNATGTTAIAQAPAGVGYSGGGPSGVASALEPPAGKPMLVVALGASSGGLEACGKLLDAMPAGIDAAFILVQHMQPDRESLLVDLLSAHTSMTVREAVEGMRLERGHLYIIPPGRYLTVGEGTLHLQEPTAPHGARLPFDFLLNSLADAYGNRAVCVVLSGTGTDGTLGLTQVSRAGGSVIAQEPREAGEAGMPKSAIATGLVARTLAVADIGPALAAYEPREDGDQRVYAASATADHQAQPGEATSAPLTALIALIQAKTTYDFTLYKTGTLQRRVERRMGVTVPGTGDIDAYIASLREDDAELELLAKDLLINVTGFFRDAAVFVMLRDELIPGLLRDAPPDRPLRIWVAGCSSGEEAYSIAMVATEAIAREGSDTRLQVFASDLDADAIQQAREGLYPQTIAADVSPERIQRFFERQDAGYRVLPDLRGTVIFTVQNVLADPPFSRIDLVSCRNLLIYLGAEAQKSVVQLFHFALRPAGILLLGSSETAGDIEGRFEVVSKPERLYRRIGRNRPADAEAPAKAEAKGPDGPAASVNPRQSRQTALAELCRRTAMEAYLPAAVLINRRQNCLFSIGPTERYLKVATGFATQDLVSMVAPELRTRLTAAIRQAGRGDPHVVTEASRTKRGGKTVSVVMEIRFLLLDTEELLLVSFIDEPAPPAGAPRSAGETRGDHVAQLERELEATRGELKEALRDLEGANEEQRTINEEALSVNEEYQSTNEELLTSKEELQSLNEELTALNSQLQETLERQRTTSNDLQNVLYSTDVATIFLDANLDIRFFTPATKSLFRVIPGDVGRPLSDLNSLASDTSLSDDARDVLRSAAGVEREIEVPEGLWFTRKILPYRAHDGSIEGVVITFTDITAAKKAADALEAAKRQAELANIAKSRFLAAASHDLRQPLQSLVLLQGLLAKSVLAEEPSQLVGRMTKTLNAMSGMLNTLLDIKQIEAGVVRPKLVDFPIDDLLGQLEEEFGYQARAQRLVLRRVASSASVRSDPDLLGQIVRNLISNALKYTKDGEILIGCRPRGVTLVVEIWDTGLGIAEHELEAIFEEYHQVENVARERSLGLGLGLGLPIVRRLADLLGHAVRVRSVLGRGSVFSIDVPIAAVELPPSPDALQRTEAGVATPPQPSAVSSPGGTLIVIEDDPDVRDLLEMLLIGAGHRVVAAADGAGAIKAIRTGSLRPDVILTDYNLPGRSNGIELAREIRLFLARNVPVIVLTGDISTNALLDISSHDCIQLNKPVDAHDLTDLVASLLEREKRTPTAVKTPETQPRSAVFVVDDDENVRDAIRSVIEADGRTAEVFEDGETFLSRYSPREGCCLLLDARLPGLGGLDILKILHDRGDPLPVLMITGHGDVATAVAAMKVGAVDFIEKPITGADLLSSIDRALDQTRDSGNRHVLRESAKAQIQLLTQRQHQIMDLILAGHPNMNIAADLGISQRTVENHRAAIMSKTGSKSLPDLARLALTADRDAESVAHLS